MAEYLGLGQAVRDTPMLVMANQQARQAYASRYGGTLSVSKPGKIAGRMDKDTYKPQFGTYGKEEYTRDFGGGSSGNSDPNQNWDTNSINRFSDDTASGRSNLSTAVKATHGIIGAIERMSSMERAKINPVLGYTINDIYSKRVTDYRRGANMDARSDFGGNNAIPGGFDLGMGYNSGVTGGANIPAGNSTVFGMDNKTVVYIALGAAALFLLMGKKK